MKRRSKAAPADKPAAPEGRLSGVRPLAHDDDERPSRQDRGSDHSLFDIPVRVPKFLTRGKSRSGG
jgi:hypothetical protein